MINGDDVLLFGILWIDYICVYSRPFISLEKRGELGCDVGRMNFVCSVCLVWALRKKYSVVACVLGDTVLVLYELS